MEGIFPILKLKKDSNGFPADCKILLIFTNVSQLIATLSQTACNCQPIKQKFIAD